MEATDRRRYERELLLARRRAEQLAEVVNASGDAILLMAPDGTIQSWNRGAEQLFGHTAEEAGTIERVICEYQSYAEEHMMRIIQAILFQGVEGRMEEIERTLGHVLREAATIEQRLTTSAWLVGEGFSSADIVVFPGIQMLLRSLERREAHDLRARFLPLESNFPAIAAWIGRIQALPGYERTVPPHWKE
jgi:PAS domain S-box-containing protein